MKRLTFKNKGNGMLVASNELTTSTGEKLSAVVDTNTMTFHVVTENSDKPVAGGNGMSVQQVKSLVKQTLQNMGVSFETETRKKRSNVDQRVN